MSEVRAPDPTLSQTEHRVVYVNHYGVDPPVAHVQGGCGAQLVNQRSPENARWYAVPCRTCFPDAPPPGTDPLNRPNAGRYLAWQVA